MESHKSKVASEIVLLIAKYREYVYPKYTHVEMYKAVVAASRILTEA